MPAPCLSPAGLRIRLRPWRDDDAQRLYHIASDPELGPRAGWMPHRDTEESLSVINNFFKNDSTWAVVLKHGDTIVGCVGYLSSRHSNFPIAPDEAEVGYWIAKPYWGQGLCTEALSAIVDYCRSLEDIKALWGVHFLDNPASGRVLEKCGFEDTLRRIQCPSLVCGADKTTRVLKLNL